MRSEEPSGGGAGAVALPAELAAAASAPQIAQVNVSRNSRMHIGPQFVSVTQNVHQDRVVKEAGVWRVAWAWVRATSRGERVACAAVLLALVLCAVAAGVLAAPRAPDPEPDPAPHEWNITRAMWLAGPHGADEESWAPAFLPLRLVIVQHTVGSECFRFADCAALMREMQTSFFKEKKYDLPYNFVIGNDARVYEGRGWDVVGAHTYKYNRCALGLAFTGNYHNGTGGAVPTAAQLQRMRGLLAVGVRAGYVHAEHFVLGARDVQASESPGDALYAALRRWPEAPADAQRFRDRSCTDIYAELSRLDTTTLPPTPPAEKTAPLASRTTSEPPPPSEPPAEQAALLASRTTSEPHD